MFKDEHQLCQTHGRGSRSRQPQMLVKPPLHASSQLAHLMLIMLVEFVDWKGVSHAGCKYA
jgi:hypothetical protein